MNTVNTDAAPNDTMAIGAENHVAENAAASTSSMTRILVNNMAKPNGNRPSSLKAKGPPWGRLIKKIAPKCVFEQERCRVEIRTC